jgi:sugar/nucleoside kinase (ribokinase family)
VVIKKGEHGAILIGRDAVCPLPAYPVEGVRDPTGAGDCFAGGMMGYLARAGDTGTETFKAALASGTVLSSFEVEDFGVRRLMDVTREEVQSRFLRYCSLLKVEGDGF